MTLCPISCAIFVAAFAYIMLILANKESGNMKIAGQVITALIGIVALTCLYMGIVGGGKCGSGDMMGGKGMMGSKDMKCQMMTKMMKEDPSMMQNMCKDPAMKKMMQDAVKKAK